MANAAPFPFFLTVRNSATIWSDRGTQRSAALGTSRTFLRSAHNKIDVRSQIRQQFAARIIGINFHGVGDHILGHGGIQPYFAYLPGKDHRRAEHLR